MADDNPSPESAAPPPAPAGRSPWVPALVAVVLAPVLTWAVAQFVLLPQLQASLVAESETPAGMAAAVPDRTDPPAPGDAAAPGGSEYRIENVVVNLAGTMGTRYLKASFLVTGSDPQLVQAFEDARPQVGDVTLAVLSGLTLADLEEPGSKNIIRERLVDAYNQIFGARIAENLYFSEFVVQ